MHYTEALASATTCSLFVAIISKQTLVRMNEYEGGNEGPQLKARFDCSGARSNDLQSLAQIEAPF